MSFTEIEIHAKYGISIQYTVQYSNYFSIVVGGGGIVDSIAPSELLVPGPIVRSCACFHMFFHMFSSRHSGDLPLFDIQIGGIIMPDYPKHCVNVCGTLQ